MCSNAVCDTIFSAYKMSDWLLTSPVMVQDGETFGHQWVLGRHSPLLWDLFISNGRVASVELQQAKLARPALLHHRTVSHMETVCCPDYSQQTVELLLDLLYTGQAQHPALHLELPAMRQLYQDLGLSGQAGGLPDIGELDTGEVDNMELIIDPSSMMEVEREAVEERSPSPVVTIKREEEAPLKIDNSVKVQQPKSKASQWWKDIFDNDGESVSGEDKEYLDEECEQAERLGSRKRPQPSSFHAGDGEKRARVAGLPVSPLQSPSLAPAALPAGPGEDYWICPRCGELFDAEPNLLAHEEKPHGHGCTEPGCPHETVTYSLHLKHLWEVHKRQKQVRLCPECNDAVDTKSWGGHSKCQHKFSCIFENCSVMTVTSKQVWDHMIKIHGHGNCMNQIPPTLLPLFSSSGPTGATLGQLKQEVEQESSFCESEQGEVEAGQPGGPAQDGEDRVNAMVNEKILQQEEYWSCPRCLELFDSEPNMNTHLDKPHIHRCSEAGCYHETVTFAQHLKHMWDLHKRMKQVSYILGIVIAV